MKQNSGVFNEIDQEAHGQYLAPCPLCGGPTGMWEFLSDGLAQKLVCCQRGEPLGDFDREDAAGGCPLFMPDRRFYRATYREAASFHVLFSEGVRLLRASRSEQPGERSAWVIERHAGGQHDGHYWDGEAWTTDIDLAVQFARERDACAALGLVAPSGRALVVVEHLWVTYPKQQGEQHGSIEHMVPGPVPGG